MAFVAAIRRKIPMKKYVLFAAALGSLVLSCPALAQETISEVTLQFRTGGDDVRGGSIVTGQLIGPNGTSEAPVNLNGGRVWGGNTTNRVRMPLPRPMTLNELRTMSVRISFDGTARNSFDGYDNWNVNQLIVMTPYVCSGGEAIGTVAGTPWVRMTGERRTATIGMSVPAELSANRVSALTLNVRTGGDDLRGGALATAIVRLNGGRAYPAVPLNSGANWPGNSMRRADIRLPEATALSDIAGVEINFDGAGRNFGEGYDNWNIDRATLNLPSACSVKIIHEFNGQPWWRATGQDNAKLISLASRDSASK
jgi:hypothetical protein